MRLAVVILALLLCSCQHRETNIALQQSDQAQEAAQRLLAERVAPRLAGLPVDAQSSVAATMDQIVQLLTASRTSIRPAIILTAGGEPLPDVRTTIDDAMDRQAYFITALGVQAGRAEAEVERVGWYAAIGSAVIKLGLSAADNWLSVMLGGGGIGGILLAFGARHIGKLKTAVRDSVAFGNEALEVDPSSPDQRRNLVARHKEIQKINGTRSLIDSAGATSTPLPRKS